MAYYLAASLKTLRNQINEKWPGRDKTSDGWIGDASHQARPSDHNPDWAAGGVVRAIDIDKDGIDVDAVLVAATSDRRTAYVIWNRRIWTPGSGWRAYTGTSPHTAHIHVSIRHGRSYETDTTPWALSPPVHEEDDMTPEQDKMLRELYQVWMPGKAGVRTEGAGYGLLRTLPEKAATAVWTRPVTLTDGTRLTVGQAVQQAVRDTRAIVAAIIKPEPEPEVTK